MLKGFKILLGVIGLLSFSFEEAKALFDCTAQDGLKGKNAEKCLSDRNPNYVMAFYTSSCVKPSKDGSGALIFSPLKGKNDSCEEAKDIFLSIHKISRTKKKERQLERQNEQKERVSSRLAKSRNSYSEVKAGKKKTTGLSRFTGLFKKKPAEVEVIDDDNATEGEENQDDDGDSDDEEDE